MLLLQDWVYKSMGSSVSITLLLSEKEYFPRVCMHAWARVCLHVYMCILGPGMEGFCVCVCACVPVCLCALLLNIYGLGDCNWERPVCNWLSLNKYV